MAFYAKCGCGLCDREAELEAKTREEAVETIDFMNFLIAKGAADDLFVAAPESKASFKLELVER